MLTCLSCKTNFAPKRTNHRNPQKYCCYQCSVDAKKPKAKHCLQCGVETKNPKYCSKSCSAISNNTGSTHSTETRDKIGKSVADATAKLSEEEKKVIIQKRNATRLKNKGPQVLSSKCECLGCKKLIPKTNKHKMCMDCYLKSDAAQMAWGHFSKSYKKGYVFSPYANKSFYLLSGLEIGYAKWLNENKINWVKPSPIQYSLNGKKKRYFPDFLLIDTNQLVEIKGYWWEGDKEKMEAVLNQHPDLNIRVLTKAELNKMGAKSIGADTSL